MGKNKNINVILENGIDSLSTRCYLLVLPKQKAIIPNNLNWVDFELFYAIRELLKDALIEKLVNIILTTSEHHQHREPKHLGNVFHRFLQFFQMLLRHPCLAQIPPGKLHHRNDIFLLH